MYVTCFLPVGGRATQSKPNMPMYSVENLGANYFIPKVVGQPLQFSVLVGLSECGTTPVNLKIRLQKPDGAVDPVTTLLIGGSNDRLSLNQFGFREVEFGSFHLMLFQEEKKLSSFQFDIVRPLTDSL